MKLTLNNVGSLIDATTAANTINGNSAAIVTALENTLSRDGTIPNKMVANIDMNSNRILNLPAPVNASEPLRLQDLSDFVGGGTVTNIPVGGNTRDKLTKLSNTNYDIGWVSTADDLVAGTNINITGTTPVTISTVTNPTFVSPSITTPTGIVKADVGLSNVDNTSDVTKWAATKTLSNTTLDTTNANIIRLAGNQLTGITGTGGTVVVSTSPVLVTPNLGTPSAGVLTNATGTAAGLTAGNVTTNANLTGDVTSVGNATTLTNAPVIAKVLTGYTSGAGTVSATDSILSAIQKLNGNDATNANLTGPITSVGNATSVASQTGTGSTFVMNTSPTLVTPNIGTPSVGVATNLTGTASGLTSGNVTTNANLTGVITSSGNATSITSQTGTGTKFVVDTSPTLVTPTLGVATATSVNKVAFTAPATSATLTIADGTTLTETTSTSIGKGQYLATSTNDNATAGNIGEYRSASNADTDGAQGSATITVTIASPAVVTWTAIPYVFNGNGTAVINFTTTGALPTGITAGTNYYVIGSSVSGNTFQIATTADNAIAGTAINTSGSQSGTHTGNPTAILVDNTSSTVAALSLTAGDWDVDVDNAFFSAATTVVTVLSTSSSTNSVAISTIPGRLSQLSFPAGNVPALANNIAHAGPARFSLSSTTTIYANVKARFTTSTLAAWGGMRARRVR